MGDRLLETRIKSPAMTFLAGEEATRALTACLTSLRVDELSPLCQTKLVVEACKTNRSCRAPNPDAKDGVKWEPGPLLRKSLPDSNRYSKTLHLNSSTWPNNTLQSRQIVPTLV